MAQTPAQPAQAPVSPDLFWNAMEGYHRSAVIKAAIELEVFTALGAGALTSDELAKKCSASPRGMRTLCDYLTIMGFLTKAGQRYASTPSSATFLDKKSPAYLGSVVGFLQSPYLMEGWRDVAGSVRRGGAAPTSSSLHPEHPMWIEFARSMAPMMRQTAHLVAHALLTSGPAPQKVLDIAAGHGLFGLSVAQSAQQAQVYGADWANVLTVAQENARAMGLADRYHTLPGSAFEVDLGSGYDLVLLPNFIHHFDAPTNEGLLRKLHAALRPGGRLAIVEFVPHEDRVSPPQPAMFSMVMLNSTPHGDAYTHAEIDRMCRGAGFGPTELKPLPPTPQSLVIVKK